MASTALNSKGGDGAHSRMTLARERIAASCPDRAQHCTIALQRRFCSLQCTPDSGVSGSPDEQRLPSFTNQSVFFRLCP